MAVKKIHLVYGAAVLAAIGAGLIPRHHEKWTDESSGSNLLLSLKGSGENTKLEIRCGGGKTEVRLYMPIGLKPAFGGPSGDTASMGLTETYKDADQLPLPKSDAPYGNAWQTGGASHYAYAVKQDPLAFVDRLMDKQWLSITGSSFEDPTRAAGTDFPVMGLSDYRDRIAASCKES